MNTLIQMLAEITEEERNINNYFQSILKGNITQDFQWHEEMIDGMEKVISTKDIPDIIYNSWYVLDGKSLLFFAHILKKRYGMTGIQDHKFHTDIYNKIARYLV